MLLRDRAPGSGLTKFVPAHEDKNKIAIKPDAIRLILNIISPFGIRVKNVSAKIFRKDFWPNANMSVYDPLVHRMFFSNLEGIQEIGDSDPHDGVIGIGGKPHKSFGWG